MSQLPVKPPLPAVAGAINIPNSPLAHHNYTWAQQSSVSFTFQKVRLFVPTFVALILRKITLADRMSNKMDLLRYFSFARHADVTTKARTIITTSIDFICAISITDIFKCNSGRSAQCECCIRHGKWCLR